MKLLILTQKVDREDDILGFFHRWLEKFAQKFDKLIVICLQKGEYKLPANVEVFSLGKEEFIRNLQHWHTIRRLASLFRFYKYIWKLRKDYDGVFVHMNPIYVVLGGIFWKIWRKKIFLWYNHQFGNLITKMGIGLAERVFYTSPFSFASKFKKSKIMPAGIDAEKFCSMFDVRGSKLKNSILYLGRISPIKNVDVLIEAANLLDKEGIDFILNIVGEPGEKDREYFEKIRDLSKELEKKGKIKFLGKVPNYKTPEIYNQNEVFVNLSPPGLFDKAILEAMACENLVLVSSSAFGNILPEYLIFKEKNPEDLKNKILGIFEMKKEEKEWLGRELREKVIQTHNLDILVEKLISEFQTKL